MALPYANYVKVECPSCHRPIAGAPIGDGLRLIKHLTPRRGGVQTWCEASDRTIVRSVSGTWRLEK